MHYTFAVIAESLEILEAIYCSVRGGVKLCYFGPAIIIMWQVIEQAVSQVIRAQDRPAPKKTLSKSRKRFSRFDLHMHRHIAHQSCKHLPQQGQSFL
jgi:hypothetical protein